MNAFLPKEQSLRYSILFAGVFDQLFKVTRKGGRLETGRLQKRGKISKHCVALDFHAIFRSLFGERNLKETITCMARCRMHDKDEGQHVAYPLCVDHHCNSMT